MRAVAAAIVLSFLALALAPQAAADDDSLRVVVLVEDKTYAVGTTGKVTVQVFDKGAHADADGPPAVTMGYYPSRTINVTKTSTGVYEGPFTIQQGDTLGTSARIAAMATLGKTNQSDTSYNEDSDIVMLLLKGYASAGLVVDCHLLSVAGGAIKPGAAVTVETLVTYNGTTVSPSSFKLTVTYSNQTGDDVEETLNATNSSTGVYRATYTLPDLSHDADLDFQAQAQYQADDRSDSMSLSLDFFNVIYHKASKTSTSTTFDIYVADTGGKAVKGAVVVLRYWQDSNGSSYRSMDPLTTDSGGRVRPTLSFSEGARVLHVEGTANASGRSQGFSGTIRLSAEEAFVPKPVGDGFEVAFANREESYAAGSTINRDYYAFNDSKAWAGKIVYCYIVTNTYSLTAPNVSPASVEARNITTDAAGKFRLSIRAPAGKDSVMEVYFESATGIHPKPGYLSDHDSNDGQHYSTGYDTFMTSITMPGEVVRVSVKELKVGAPSQVEASARGGDPPLAMAAWGIGEVKNLQDPSLNTGNWAIWNEVPSVLSRSGSKYAGTISIPSFMPKDSKYTVIVLLQSDDPIPAYGMASLRPGEGTEVGAIPWLYIIIIVVVIVAVVAAVVALRRRRAPVPRSDVLNFAGAPAATQPAAVSPGGAVAPGETAGPAGPGAPPPPPPPTPPAPQPMAGAPPAQYPQPAPQQYPPPPPQYQPPAQQYQQPAPQQYPAQAPPPQYQQPPPQYPPTPAYVAAPPPAGTLPPPSRQGRVAMPNNAMCAFCNQWLLQGSTGIMCHCGKVYHEHCAKIQEQCGNCGTKLAL